MLKCIVFNPMKPHVQESGSIILGLILLLCFSLGAVYFIKDFDLTKQSQNMSARDLDLKMIEKMIAQRISCDETMLPNGECPKQGLIALHRRTPDRKVYKNYIPANGKRFGHWTVLAECRKRPGNDEIYVQALRLKPGANLLKSDDSYWPVPFLFDGGKPKIVKFGDDEAYLFQKKIDDSEYEIRPLCPRRTNNLVTEVAFSGSQIIRALSREYEVNNNDPTDAQTQYITLNKKIRDDLNIVTNLGDNPKVLTFNCDGFYHMSYYARIGRPTKNLDTNAMFSKIDLEERRPFSPISDGEYKFVEFDNTQGPLPTIFSMRWMYSKVPGGYSGAHSRQTIELRNIPPTSKEDIVFDATRRFYFKKGQSLGLAVYSSTNIKLYTKEIEYPLKEAYLRVSGRECPQ